MFCWSAARECTGRGEYSGIGTMFYYFEIPNAYRAALKEQKLELRLYRIADITETGEYRDLEKYSGLNIQELSVESSAREYKKKQKMWRHLLGLPNGMRVQRQNRMQRLN